MNLGFVEMRYPLICLGGPSFLGGIAKSLKKAKILLKPNLNKLVNLPWCRFEVEIIDSSCNPPGENVAKHARFQSDNR